MLFPLGKVTEQVKWEAGGNYLVSTMSQWLRTSLRVNVAHLPFVPVGTVGSCQQERLSEKARWIAKSQNSISYSGKKCWHRFVEICYSWDVAENYSKGHRQTWRVVEKGLS